MKINNYESIKVELLRATENPMEIISRALSMTMKKDVDITMSKKILKSIIKMNHTSVFEHINYTFFINRASRSFLAQITRHRIASYTSGSQHYQYYGDYDALGSSSLTLPQRIVYNKMLDDSLDNYKKLIEFGVPKYEARQVLPNAMENNLMVTINARSLINFFNLRLCKRNTEEIRIIAEKMFSLVYHHFKELWENIGTDCQMNKCRQGKMRCINEKCSN